MHLVILKADENGKIIMSEDEIRNIIKDAYNAGYEEARIKGNINVSTGEPLGSPIYIGTASPKVTLASTASSRAKGE